MDKKFKVNEEVEKTLQFFDRADRLKASPYLNTRIRARLDEADSPIQAKSRIWNALRPLLLAGIVAVNVITAVVFFQNSDTGRQERIQTFAEAYALDSVNENFFGK